MVFSYYYLLLDNILNNTYHGQTIGFNYFVLQSITYIFYYTLITIDGVGNKNF